MLQYLKKLIFFSFLLFIADVSALPTFINGKAIRGSGLLIRLNTYTDQISFQESILDMEEIKSDELFQLGFEIADIQEVFLNIGNQSFSFYAQAGKSYHLTIDNIEVLPKSALAEQNPLHIVWNEKNELNEVIDNFNYEFGDFLETNFIALYKNRDAKLLGAFEQEIEKKRSETKSLSEHEQAFFKDYIAYQFADLKYASQTVSDKTLGETYFQNKPVLYNNSSYMLFFQHYFNQYFSSGKRTINYHEFVDLMRTLKNLAQLMDFVGKDPVLVQERLRELVLLNALKEIYYNKDFDSVKVGSLIKSIALQSKFKEHKKIGVAVLNQLTALKTGMLAPSLELKSTAGTVKNLTYYQGKYVYLFFISDNCQACEQDLSAIRMLNEKYRNDIAFVSVLVNYTKNGQNKLSQLPNTPWDKLLFANNFNLLNTYKVRSFPLYILLDREGKILLYPAKKPHEDIDRFFDYLIQRDKAKNTKPDELFR
jgi:thioredoxin-related protein